MNSMNERSLEVEVCAFEDLDDPGCYEFRIGEGDWPFKGFVVRQGQHVYAYQNYCRHVGHPLNWKPNDFLTADGSEILCASHGARYSITSGIGTSALCKGKALRKVDVWIKEGLVFVRGPTHHQ